MKRASDSCLKSKRVSKKRGDKVYTPEWVALDMIQHFCPSGRVLEPCRGRGVFTDLLPTAGWCELDEGRDFFAFEEPVDWVIGNPPYSLTRPWFRHTYKVAEQFVYLVPLRNVFSGFGFIREIYDYGGIVEIRNYGGGARLGFPMGNAIGAMHCRRGYRGDTRVSFAERR
jgi:hypothetical protein